MDVTIVTYEKYPDLAPDDRFFREALERAGASVRAAIWSDPHVDWAETPVTVVRAVWDYPQRFAEFQSWLDRVELQTQLVNTSKIVRWNMHKQYLADLAARGIAIVPTVFVGAREEIDLVETCRDRGWTDIVMKPCVGGSSFGTVRVSEPTLATVGASHLRALQDLGDAMIQPYLTEIEDAAERAFIYIGGAFSHAVRKAPFNSSTVTTSEQLHAPSASEAAFARAVLDVLDEAPAYARVDVVPTAHGNVLMELELIEPTLYFEFEPRAAQRLAELVWPA